MVIEEKQTRERMLDDVFQLQLWGKSREEGGVDLIPEA